VLTCLFASARVDLGASRNNATLLRYFEEPFCGCRDPTGKAIVLTKSKVRAASTAQRRICSSLRRILRVATDCEACQSALTSNLQIQGPLKSRNRSPKPNLQWLMMGTLCSERRLFPSTSPVAYARISSNNARAESPLGIPVFDRA